MRINLSGTPTTFGFALVVGLSGTLGAQQHAVKHITDPRPAVAAGKLIVQVVHDSTYHRDRRIWIYTPPHYDARRGHPYPLIVAFDGNDYRDERPLPMVLDTLLAAGKAPPFIAVLVDDSTGEARLADLVNQPRMLEFLSRQLIPWVRSRWNVTRDARRVIVTGYSAGGIAAAYAAFSRPDLFGNVFTQSGAFWGGHEERPTDPPFEWLTTKIENATAQPVRFFMEVGSEETRPTGDGTGPSLLVANRHLRDALGAKGYEVTLVEIPGGRHHTDTWRPHLADGLAALVAAWRK